MKTLTPYLGRGLRNGLLVLLLVGTLFPLYFLIVTSFKTNEEFSGNYFLPAFAPTFDNILSGLSTMAKYMGNSLIVTLATTVIVLVVVVPAVYALTWLRLPSSGIIYASIIAPLVVPPVLTFVPQFILVKNLGLLNDYWGLILPFVATGIGMSVYLLRSFFIKVPFEMIEAARIDGARELQILRVIVVPLAIPSILTVAVTSIVAAWNAFLWPLVVMTSESKRVVSVAVTFLAGESQQIDTTALIAGYLAASLPLMLILGVLLRFFVRGLMEGAVKG